MMFWSKRRHDAPLPYVKCRPTTNPILPVSDVAEASDFYRSLGFEVVAYDEGYAWVKHCGWEWFHLARVDDLELGGGNAAASLHVEDAGEWHAAITEASAGSVDIPAPENTPWGKHEFAFLDPYGNRIRIGSPS